MNNKKTRKAYKKINRSNPVSALPLDNQFNKYRYLNRDEKLQLQKFHYQKMNLK
jgi:hypothetical protein